MYNKAFNAHQQHSTLNTERRNHYVLHTSIDQPGLPTSRLAVHRDKHTIAPLQVKYKQPAQTERHYQQTVHVNGSSDTITARDSKHEDAYMARVTHNKTLYKDTNADTYVRHEHGHVGTLRTRARTYNVRAVQPHKRCRYQCEQGQV